MVNSRKNDAFVQRVAYSGRLIRACWQHFGKSTFATSSFQTQSLPLLHLIAQEAPGVPVVFLDTQKHFPETLLFRDAVVAQLGLRLIVLYPEPRNLSEPDNPDACCGSRKLQPLKKFAAESKVWINGIRADQTDTRREKKHVEKLGDRVIRLYPLLDWDEQDVDLYRKRHKLPAHRLDQLGFRSIGCHPCTVPSAAKQDARFGRWAGQTKSECGLHFPNSL